MNEQTPPNSPAASVVVPDRSICEQFAVANGMVNLAREFLEAGSPPDAIYSGMMAAAMKLMRGQGMSEMQIANRLELSVDQAQDYAFGGPE